MSANAPFGTRRKPSERSDKVLSGPKKLLKLVENQWSRQLPLEEYKRKVHDVYSGPQGALLSASSKLSLHTQMGERLFRSRQFDLHGLRRALDVGSGAGQMALHLLKYGDPELAITCTDLSTNMLRRARQRIHNSRPRWATADVTHLPFADESFDCVTCGYVIEHLPDVRVGLRELARVMIPGGRALLLVTEDSFSGAWTSRLWRCRTCNRHEFRHDCEDSGFIWHRELWFTKMHKMLRAGGICVELRKK
jgi:ubiquinone/menaquinone biosynthesis C-methylase UbiE